MNSAWFSIIFMSIGVIFLIVSAVGSYYEKEIISVIGNILSLISCILMIISFVSMFKLSSLMYKNSYIISETPEISMNVYAINDDSQINGRMFYRSGYIEEKEYIQFIVKNSDEGKEIRKVCADTVSFYETGDTPRIETYIGYKEVKWLFFKDSAEQRYYKFYVPENSVTDEFVIDLE